jgi:hypothetical protein
MVTLATLLTATTFKKEPKRQMKRKPDQQQSTLTGSSPNHNFFNKALREKERKPDNIQNSKQMTLSTIFNFKFATLQKYSSKENDSQNSINS